MVGNDKYVLKYNRVEGLKGYLQTMSKANYAVSSVKVSQGTELLLVAGDSKCVMVFLNRVWLVAAFLL